MARPTVVAVSIGCPSGIGPEVAVLAAYVVTPIPARVVGLVSVLLTAHVPIGVILPAWTATRRVFREDVWQTALAIAAIWTIAAAKVMGR